MERSMLIVGVFATLGVVASAVLGYVLASPEDVRMQMHVLVSLASTLLALFSHSWILLYLMGTGRAVQGAIRREGLDAELSRRTRRLKTFTYPLVLLAMVLVLGAFALGAAATANYTPVSSHHIAFYAALVVQGAALWAEARVLRENERLLLDVDGRLAAAV
ncbi:MAG TPA: hypothetical protein VG477_07980 [Thermoanaerobaculia bacterium]|nr:hypothetical protein [Thermoanaerobaculia bacterium]